MKVLNKWGKYLQSPKSCYVLNKKDWGWFGKPAQDAMPDFQKEFVYVIHLLLIMATNLGMISSPGNLGMAFVQLLLLVT